MAEAVEVCCRTSLARDRMIPYRRAPDMSLGTQVKRQASCSVDQQLKGSAGLRSARLLPLFDTSTSLRSGIAVLFT